MNRPGYTSEGNLLLSTYAVAVGCLSTPLVLLLIVSLAACTTDRRHYCEDEGWCHKVPGDKPNGMED